jgi:predicted O-methyltransferase YrrM
VTAATVLPPRFTFLLPTVGRPTLKRMLESLAAQEVLEGEEVLLVSDDRHQAVGKVWRASGLRGTHLAVVSGPLGRWGHPIRRLLSGGTYLDYVWHLDDDDVLAPDAVARVRRVVARSRLPLYLFRFYCAASKRYFWPAQDRGFLDQVGTHNVIHAARLPLADWPDAYNGDGMFIAETCRINDIRPCWRPEVIYLANPGDGGLEECWRRLPPEPDAAAATGVTLDSIPGYFDFGDYYDQVAASLPDGATAVEVGNLYGKSLAYLADALKCRGRRFTLYGVDHGIDSVTGSNEVICGELLGNLRALGLEREVRLLVMSSQQAAQLFADGSLDFVFIDAAHGFDDVRADLACWWPKIRPGGLLAGHDYNADWPGVVRAVDEFFAGRARRPAVASQSCWEARKPLA